MSFPPAHLLVGAGVAEGIRALVPLPRWRAWGVAAALAVLPDADLAIDLLLRRAETYHGTFTHSLAAVAVVALAAWVAAGPRWSALAAAGYGSHLVVDLLDDRGRTNVLLGWPLTDERPFAIARVFAQVPFEHGQGITGAALSLTRPEVFLALLDQTLDGAVFFAGLLALAAVYRRTRGGDWG